jgi:hypothetical protein
MMISAESRGLRPLVGVVELGFAKLLVKTAVVFNGDRNPPKRVSAVRRAPNLLQGSNLVFAHPVVQLGKHAA